MTYNVLSGTLSLYTTTSINKVNLHQARLALRWVTVYGFNSQGRTFISLCNQPPRSTQPGHPFWVSAMSRDFLFSVHTITEAKQRKAISRAEPGQWIFQPGHLIWRALV